GQARAQSRALRLLEGAGRHSVRDPVPAREEAPHGSGRAGHSRLSASRMALKELIETIAQALVDDPDGVEVTELERDHGAVIELRVSKGDIGKVIGKDGRTAQSMRTLLAAASTKVGKRVHLDIVD